ncbi:MAG TPA: hypothetical protein VN737_18925 [Bryobacteraceae bacterium]|jgi:hypothetical protein|nr:hypothetical protein [Bryobacteraceae bacterium]
MRFMQLKSKAYLNVDCVMLAEVKETEPRQAVITLADGAVHRIHDEDVGKLLELMGVQRDPSGRAAS